ncbi:MAG: trimeric intracellular cation channel family protein [Nitrospirota bacterium]
MDVLLKTIEALGIIAFAVTGIFEARKKKMDIVGVYVVAMITALGGGSLRDIILNRHPFFWVEYYQYPILLLFLSIFSVGVMKKSLQKPRLVLLVLTLDAVGLGLFSASGASLAYQSGCHAFIASIIGVVTGVFGGVMRDISCNEIPHVFQRTELYATCSFVGAWVYLIVFTGSMNEVFAVLSCVFVTFILRMLAIRYKITLPI